MPISGRYFDLDYLHFAANVQIVYLYTKSTPGSQLRHPRCWRLFVMFVLFPLQPSLPTYLA